MRDKTEQIINAAIKVFLKKGFLQSTTQEIAKEADVAEVTLYRKFSTKQNLYFTVIKKIIENHFQSKILKLAEHENTNEFLKKIFYDRLTTISKNNSVVRVLLSESLIGHLKEEINLPILIFASLKNALEVHFNFIKKEVDVDQCARIIGGIFLSHVAFPVDEPFHKMTDEEKEAVVNKYVSIIEILL